MPKPVTHPSAYLPEYRKYVQWLTVGGIAQFLWALTLLYYSARPPQFLREYSNPSFQPGIIYSAYSMLHGGYILISLLLTVLLHSRGWLRAAAFGSMVPGFGIFFGIFQIVPGYLAFRELGRPHWVDFFRWRDKTHPLQ